MNFKHQLVILRSLSAAHWRHSNVEGWGCNFSKGCSFEPTSDQFPQSLRLQGALCVMEEQYLKAILSITSHLSVPLELLLTIKTFELL